MCECCKEKNNPIYSKVTQYSDSIYSNVVEIKEQSLNIGTLVQDIKGLKPHRLIQININYCPMCGRDLRGDSENE